MKTGTYGIAIGRGEKTNYLVQWLKERLEATTSDHSSVPSADSVGNEWIYCDSDFKGTKMLSNEQQWENKEE